MSSLGQMRRQGRLPDSGARRVTFTEQTIYDSNSEDEENEEERLLSELHGEAEESGTTSSRNDDSKRKETDQDIASELVQEESRIKKKPRPTLQVKDLLTENGLIKIPIEFAAIPYRPKKGSKRDIAAAAAYSRALVTKVRQFCDDLFPSMAYEDVLLKIEQFGGKKETKAYLQHAREEVRNRHLEHLYGKEKSEKMIQELENGLAAQQHLESSFEDGGEDGDYGRNTIDETVDRRDAETSPNPTEATTRLHDSPLGSSPPRTAANLPKDRDHSASDDMDDDEEHEANFDDEDNDMNLDIASAAPPSSKTHDGDMAQEHHLPDKDREEGEGQAIFEDMAVESRRVLKPNAHEQQEHIPSDDDDDEAVEATFDDMASDSPQFTKINPKGRNATVDEKSGSDATEVGDDPTKEPCTTEGAPAESTERDCDERNAEIEEQVSLTKDGDGVVAGTGMAKDVIDDKGGEAGFAQKGGKGNDIVADGAEPNPNDDNGVANQSMDVSDNEGGNTNEGKPSGANDSTCAMLQDKPVNDAVNEAVRPSEEAVEISSSS